MKSFGKHINKACIGGYTRLMAARASANQPYDLRKVRKGAVTFEYILILVIMVGVVIGAFTLLSGVANTKINEVKAAIEGTTIDGNINGANPGWGAGGGGGAGG